MFSENIFCDTYSRTMFSENKIFSRTKFFKNSFSYDFSMIFLWLIRPQKLILWLVPGPKKIFFEQKNKLFFSPRKGPNFLLPRKSYLPSPTGQETPSPNRDRGSPTNQQSESKKVSKNILFFETYPFPRMTIFKYPCENWRTDSYPPSDAITITSWKTHKYIHWWSESEILPPLGFV